MSRISKLLIANRGEIAMRIMRTTRLLGLRSVAVFSDADRRALHVRTADEAVHIGGSASSDSYLVGSRLIAAALRTGATAIHPGYGFLSENAGFAAEVARAGLLWVGPPASAIEAMGSKSASKEIMIKAGVPVVPGYHGDEQDNIYLKKKADEIGYPVLIKAVLGGGGKGMRIVERAAEFEEGLLAARREARSSFGDERVLIERYIKRPRHIEFQVFCDQHGNAVHLFERDCSVQRRHQKVLEESPSPSMTESMRRDMGHAACEAARAVGYVGAGTVEFIFDCDTREFFFMEMNTRLQVEHPVTEMVTGIDLVAWQIAVAQGDRLPATQDELRLRGHALEARIYAEAPEKGFLPGAGPLEFLRAPRGEPGAVRVETGVEEGDDVSIFYDPMIAKLVVHAESRPAALQRMAAALAEYQIAGLHTNVDFLRRCVAHPEFASGELDTSFIARNKAALFPREGAPDEALALAAVRLALWEEAQHPPPAARIPHNFYLSGAATREYDLAEVPAQDGAQDLPLTMRHVTVTERVGAAAPARVYTVSVTSKKNNSENLGEKKKSTKSDCKTLSVRVDALQEHALRAEVDGQRFGCVVVPGKKDRVLTVFFGERTHHFVLPMPVLGGGGAGKGGACVAPMPGKVISVLVKGGDKVVKGQALCVVMAMKMEHTVRAGANGVVGSVLVQPEEQVQADQEMIRFEEEVKKK